MSAKKWAKDYLSFNRSDRVAVVILVLLIILLFFVPGIVSHLRPHTPVSPDTAWLASLPRLSSIETDSTDDNKTQHWQYDRTQHHAPPVAMLFYFDPNTLNHAGWKRLGLRDKTIETILNYRAKGGKFRAPEDLSRIYGLREGDYAKLKAYVRIVASSQERTGEAKPPILSSSKNSIPRYTPVDVNFADTTAFINLPGIGSKLAARIVNFRDKLGGFYSIAQVGETFGLADSVFQKIRPYLKMENSAVKTININTATLDELKTHPYIRYAIAKTIIAYRDQHGRFNSPDELKKINSITVEVFDKIIHYLEL